MQNIDESEYERAVELILESESKSGRLHVTGIGKSGHVASYIASLLSSTGTASYFLDATEAIHGSSGQVREGDIVICISNSGETAELKSTINAIKNIGCKVIAVTGNAASSIANMAEVAKNKCYIKKLHGYYRRAIY